MQPASSSSSVSYNARGSARPLQQGDTFLMGPIQLPHGMTIQSLACKLRDADDAGRIYVGLRRFSLSESDPADNGDTIVSVTSFSVGSSDDYVVLQRDADSQTSIVDNANYQYHLRVDMLDLAGTPQNLELAGCRVQLGKAPE